MTDHLDKLVADGVITIERLADGTTRIELTEAAWMTMTDATSNLPRTQPMPRADKQRASQRRRDNYERD